MYLMDTIDNMNVTRIFFYPLKTVENAGSFQYIQTKKVMVFNR